MRSNLLSIFFLFLTFSCHSKNNDTIIIRQHIDTNYRANIDYLKVLMDQPSNRKVLLKSGENLSNIIFEQYRIDEKSEPNLYKLFVSNIELNNKLEDINNITAGKTIVLPDLPAVSLKYPNPNNPYNKIPKISTTDIIFSKQLPQAQVFPTIDGDIAVYDFKRKGAQKTIQIRTLDKNIALDLIKKNPSFNEVVSASISVDFAYTQSSSHNRIIPFPTESERRKLDIWLPSNIKKKSILVILDDDWPDCETFISSRDFLEKSIKDIRKSYKIKKKPFSDRLLRFSCKESFGDSHALKIKKSLKSLNKLKGSQDGLITIFLPLSISEKLPKKFTKEILSQLIEIREISQTMRNKFGDFEVEKDVQASALKLSEKIIKKLSSNSMSNKFETDYAIIDSVHEFFKIYSSHRKQPYFLNMSWTVPDLQFPPKVGIGYGLLIAAAGNEGNKYGTTVYDLGRQYANRSQIEQDVLAVMDITEGGEPRCCNNRCSSIFNLDEMNFTIAISGSTRNGDCGTSYSAPRVAWLLAQSEAKKYAPKNKPNWQKNWYALTRQYIKNLRNFNENSFGKLRFQIDELITQP